MNSYFSIVSTSRYRVILFNIVFIFIITNHDHLVSNAFEGRRACTCFFPHSSQEVEADPSPGSPLRTVLYILKFSLPSLYSKRKSIWSTRPIQNVYYYFDDNSMIIEVRSTSLHIIIPTVPYIVCCVCTSLLFNLTYFVRRLLTVNASLVYLASNYRL